jgi:outer membrane protein
MWTHKGSWDQNTSWALSLSLSYPIFDGWAVSSEIESARAIKDIFDQSLERLKRDINLDVYKRLNELNVTAFNVEAYAKQVLLAKENYEIAAARYRTGNASFLDMLNAEVNNNQFRINYDKAICDYKLYKAALLKATGEKLY